MKRHSYLFAAFSVGKLTRETCGRMLGVLSSRVAAPGTGGRLEVFTDGNDDYVHMLPVIFRVENLRYGQLVKVRDGRGRLMGKERRVVFGDPDVEEIETVNVENFNGILRERLGRLVRRSKCVSPSGPRMVA